ncbi:hypothetical protein BGX27_004734, partial [Mortierella sp. AM989]
MPLEAELKVVFPSSSTKESMANTDDKTLAKWIKELDESYPWYRPSKLAPKHSDLHMISKLLFDLTIHATLLHEMNIPHYTFTLNHITVGEGAGDGLKARVKLVKLADVDPSQMSEDGTKDMKALQGLMKTLLMDKFPDHMPDELKTYMKYVKADVISCSVASFCKALKPLEKPPT